MTIDTDLAVATRDALPLPNSPNSATTGNQSVPATATPDDGVTLSLSAQGRLLAAVSVAADAADVAAANALAGTTRAVADSHTIPRLTLYAIEARLLAARTGADAIGRADRELPPSNDPVRLRQAAQATDSLYGRAPNPFAGLPRSALSAIVYDESGAYTANERFAAASQRAELDRAYWQPVFERAFASGDWRPVIEAGIVFYAGLSSLEQGAYPANYVQLMQQYLALQNVVTPGSMPPAQQLQLASMLQSLILPSGPLVLGGAVLMPRLTPSASASTLAAPGLVDLLSVSAMVRGTENANYQVLLQRLFGVGRREDEPAVAQRLAQSLSAREFLSLADRRYLADAYGYAAVGGLALEEVDALAMMLARYRLARAGGVLRGAAAGRTTGAQVRMSAQDMAVAQRLLGSRAARETTLDHGFLAWLLNPGGGWRELDPDARLDLGWLHRLLAGLAGVDPRQAAGDDAALDGDYRYALYRIGLLQMAQGASAPDGMPLQAQALAALARNGDDPGLLDDVLVMLRMYRTAFNMSAVEQRILSELVYAGMRRRRLRLRQRPRRSRLLLAWASAAG